MRTGCRPRMKDSLRPQVRFFCCAPTNASRVFTQPGSAGVRGAARRRSGCMAVRRAGAAGGITGGGILSGGNFSPAFIKGIAETGYEDGRNIRIEFVRGRYDELPAMAQE